MVEKHIIERARELAASGRYRGSRAIIDKLTSEGYTHADDHLRGLGIRRDLQKLWTEARNRKVK